MFKRKTHFNHVCMYCFFFVCLRFGFIRNKKTRRKLQMLHWTRRIDKQITQASTCRKMMVDVEYETTLCAFSSCFFPFFSPGHLLNPNASDEAGILFKWKATGIFKCNTESNFRNSPQELKVTTSPGSIITLLSPVYLPITDYFSR